MSRPYLQMTNSMVKTFGVWSRKPKRAFTIRYRARDIEIEGDWSGSSYLLAAAAVTTGDVFVGGLRWETAQSDRHVAHLLGEFGAHSQPVDGRKQVLRRIPHQRSG